MNRHLTLSIGSLRSQHSPQASNILPRLRNLSQAYYTLPSTDIRLRAREEQAYQFDSSTLIRHSWATLSCANAADHKEWYRWHSATVNLEHNIQHSSVLNMLSYSLAQCYNDSYFQYILYNALFLISFITLSCDKIALICDNRNIVSFHIDKGHILNIICNIHRL